MKTMSRMFWALFVFFLVMVPFYGIWNKWSEATGPGQAWPSSVAVPPSRRGAVL